MGAYLFYAPRFRPLDLNGATLPLSYLQFYLTATTTPAPIYADGDLTTPLDNPVEADGAGQYPPIYLDPFITYRVQLYDADDVLLDDADPLAPPRDFPTGTVMFFYGDSTARDAAYPPDLWQVLDGTNDTPDARDRLLMFAGGSYDAGDTGGTGAASTTSAAPDHDHGGSTEETTLTEAQMPSHSHDIRDRGAGSGIADATGLTSTISIAGIRSVAEGAYVTNNSAGHPYVDAAGSGDPHTHDIDADGGHTHTVTVTPPFVALWALMRRS